MKPTTTQQKLSPLVGLRPVSAEPFVIRFLAALMFIRLCGFQVRAILLKRLLKRGLASSLSRSFQKQQRMAILLTGNQIGLATTYVREYFHPGFVAKRMELGAVVGAAPRKMCP